MITQAPQTPIHEHDHRVTVVITLECGHVRMYPLPARNLGMNPAYARPGVLWNCQPCGKTYPPKRTITATRYEYGCAECERDAPEQPGPDDAAADQLPTFQRFEWGHEHGPEDIAGYVVVQVIRNGVNGYRLADVAQVAGAEGYARAITAARQYNKASAPETAAAIVPVYADGCRLDSYA